MEQWKTAEGFKNYSVSDKGRVYSHISKRIIKGSLVKGYRSQALISDSGEKKHVYFHQLVARAFIPNLENKKCVNHIDCNPLNNDASNLEWVTHYENMMWMHKTGRAKRTKEWLDNLHKSQKKFYRPVVGTNKITGEKLYFECLNSVKSMGFRPGDVCKCCKGQKLSASGYTWEYTEGVVA